MNIDWFKLIDNLLPRVLRQTLISSFIYVFTFPLREIHDEFIDWKNKMKIMISGTPQVCMLEKIVKDSLGVDIIISEGDGKPVDFIIQASFSDIDKERQLFALIDRYKLAGKRYEYKNTALSIESYWDEYVCEQQTAFISWGGYVCEEKYRPARYVYLLFDGQYVTAEVKEPFASDLNVRIYRYDYDPDTGGAINWYEVSFSFPKGFVGTLRKDFPYNFHVMTNVVLSKQEDKEYIYKYKIV